MRWWMRRVTARAMTLKGGQTGAKKGVMRVAGSTYGSRTEKALTTRSFEFKLRLRRATRYIEIEKMRTSVMMSNAVMAVQRPFRFPQLSRPCSHNCLGLHGAAIRAMATMAHTVDKPTVVHDAMVCPFRGDRRMYRNNTAHFDNRRVRT